MFAFRSRSAMQELLNGLVTAASVSDSVKAGAEGHATRTTLVRAATAAEESIEYAIAQLNSDPLQLITLEGGVSPASTAPKPSPAASTSIRCDCMTL